MPNYLIKHRGAWLESYAVRDSYGLFVTVKSLDHSGLIRFFSRIYGNQSKYSGIAIVDENTNKKLIEVSNSKISPLSQVMLDFSKQEICDLFFEMSKILPEDLKNFITFFATNINACDDLKSDVDYIFYEKLFGKEHHSPHDTKYLNYVNRFVKMHNQNSTTRINNSYAAKLQDCLYYVRSKYMPISNSANEIDQIIDNLSKNKFRLHQASNQFLLDVSKIAKFTYVIEMFIGLLGSGYWWIGRLDTSSNMATSYCHAISKIIDLLPQTFARQSYLAIRGQEPSNYKDEFYGELYRSCTEAIITKEEKNRLLSIVSSHEEALYSRDSLL